MTSDVVASPRTSGSGAAADGALAAGVLLNDRYRIVSMLGRGGMGEVWRADDLVLGASVALKFLPLAVAGEPLRLEKFRAEVRLARQIAHPNVCRVFDIAEVGRGSGSGAMLPRVFLSMEFVDGEDLGSLLRRIGRLPREKAIEVARQICLGLAAAHEQGVIHRDLKPANVMVDGRGRARIMDFGLASAEVGGVRGSEAAAGTPFYMAPEQLAGESATKRSDVYALGLVLYEVFSGRPAHKLAQGATLADLRRLHESRSTPESLASVVSDIDPVVERVILRCLEPDPGERPPSALAVAAALPGGDPLSAALAAGETPSPQMVALAGDAGEGLSVRAGWLGLAACLIGVLLAIALAARGSLLTQVPMELPPDALQAKAKEVLRAVGHPPQRFSASGFISPSAYLRFLAAREVTDTSARWAPLRTGTPAAIWYWHRQGPTPIEASSSFQRRAEFMDPPALTVDSATVALDPAGRLLALEVVPASWRAEGVKSAAPEWKIVFQAAGLDMSAFKEVPPSRTPWYGSDTRAAWEGTYPGSADLPLRVEAAAEAGRITSFRLIGPWYQPERVVSRGGASAGLAAQLYGLLDGTVFLALVGFGGVMAWRNVKTGRGDRRGAALLAGVVCGLTWLSTVLCASQLPVLLSIDQALRRPMAGGLWIGLLTWITYLALEPAVRRLWPSILIGWVRLLDGRWRDPGVRREILVGSLVGVGLSLAMQGAAWLLDGAAQMPASAGLSSILGPRFALGDAASRAAASIFVCLAVAFLLSGFRYLFRGEFAASLGVGAVVAALVGLESWPQVSMAWFALVLAAALVALLTRLGLLAMTAAVMVERTVSEVPPVGDLNAWYLGATVTLIIVAVLPAALAGPRWGQGRS